MFALLFALCDCVRCADLSCLVWALNVNVCVGAACMRACVYAFVSACVLACACVHAFMRACVPACVPTLAHVHVCACVQVFVHSGVQARIERASVHARVHAFAFVCACMRTSRHAPSLPRTHAPALARTCARTHAHRMIFNKPVLGRPSRAARLCRAKHPSRCWS